MKQRMTVLVTRQDDLSNVCEARRKEFTDTKNLVNLLTSENDKLNGSIHGIVKQIADRIPQTEKNNEDSNAATAIASLENDRAMEIVVFFLVHNFAESANGSCSLVTDEVPAPAAGGRGYQNQETAHAQKIIASLKNQSESLYRNLSTPIELEDLQWTSRPNVESYRRYFLEGFSRQNAKLRALRNYYAAKTSRYTIIQNRLLPCIANSRESHKRPAFEDPYQSIKSEKIKESQNYRIILPDKKSNALTDREEMARNGLKKIIIGDSSTLSEANILLQRSERLRIALQKAANVNTEMLNETEANLEEILASEAQARTSDVADARSLREKERLLKNQQRTLEQDREKFMAQKEDFERYKELNAASLREERRLMDKQRRCLQQDRRDLLSQMGELRRLDLAKSGNFRGRERSLEDQRRDLEQSKREFSALNEDFERSKEFDAMNLREKERSLVKQGLEIENTKLDLSAERERLRQREIANAWNLREKERSLEKQRLEIESTKVDLAAERERLRQQEITIAGNLREKERSLEQDFKAKVDSLKEKEKWMQRNYEGKVDDLKETEKWMQRDYEAKIDRINKMEEFLEKQRRDLVAFRMELLEQKNEFQEYYEGKVGGFREQERSLDKQRRNLREDRRNLSAREEELESQHKANKANRGKELPPHVCGTKIEKWHITIPIIPEIVSWRIEWPF